MKRTMVRNLYILLVKIILLLSQIYFRVLCSVFFVRNCIFRMCEVVGDITARRNLLRKEKRCFLCLKPGHVVKKCDCNKCCFYCKGKSRNSALCIKTNRNQVTTNATHMSKLKEVPQSPIREYRKRSLFATNSRGYCLEYE